MAANSNCSLQAIALAVKDVVQSLHASRRDVKHLFIYFCFDILKAEKRMKWRLVEDTQVVSTRLNSPQMHKASLSRDEGILYGYALCHSKGSKPHTWAVHGDTVHQTDIGWIHTNTQGNRLVLLHNFLFYCTTVLPWGNVSKEGSVWHKTRSPTMPYTCWWTILPMLHFETSVVTLRAAKVGIAEEGGSLGDSNGTEGLSQLKHFTALIQDVYPVTNLL